MQDGTDGRSVLAYVRRSKTEQDGTAAHVLFFMTGAPWRSAGSAIGSPCSVRTAAGADRPGARGLNGQSIARRLAVGASAPGIEGRITGHSGRVGLASKLTARSASTTETILAGGWTTTRMVAHYSAGATAEQVAVASICDREGTAAPSPRMPWTGTVDGAGIPRSRVSLRAGRPPLDNAQHPPRGPQADRQPHREQQQVVSVRANRAEHLASDKDQGAAD